MRYLLIFLTFISISASLEAAQELKIQITSQDYRLLSQIIKRNQIELFNAMDIAGKTDFLSQLQNDIDLIFWRQEPIQSILIPKIYFGDKLDEIYDEIFNLTKALLPFAASAPKERLEEILMENKHTRTVIKNGFTCCTLQ